MTVKLKTTLKSKCAQAEAIGLLFIVLLIFVVIIIVAKLEGGTSKNNIREEYEITELSSSTLNTFLAMNKQTCSSKGKTYAEILTDCVKDETSKCSLSVTNCDAFMNDMGNLLSALFSENKLNMKYEFSISSTGTLPLEWDKNPEDGKLDVPLSSSTKCGSSYRGEDYFLPIRSGIETITITLVVCH